MSNESTLKKPIGRAQSFFIVGAFSVLLLTMLIVVTGRMRPGVTATGPVKPVEVPAVVSQGDENDVAPPALPTPSSHEQAVRQEYLQTLRDKAAVPN